MPPVPRSSAQPDGVRASGGPARTRRARLLVTGATLAVTLAAGATAATAAVQVGVYQDDPVRQLPPVAKAVGAPKVLSVYVTAGQPLDPAVVALAKRRKMRLVVSWMPDDGRPGGGKGSAKFGLKAVNAGRYDASLRELALQMRALRPSPVLRPMPEMNTSWYAWSGAARGNSAAAYVRAWSRVHRIVRRTAKSRVALMWSPYARSVPETPANAISAYFPGAARVDLVGASAYNFGDRGGLAWTGPRALFADAYRELRALAPQAPFWIAETGTTSAGGDAAAWINELASLPAAFPGMAGLVWYDVKEANGDFRLRAQRSRAAAFRAFMRGVR